MSSFNKFILFFTILFIVYDAYCYENFWLRQPSPTVQNLSEVFFINNNTGWIGGDSGTVFRTTNKGYNWTAQSTYTDNNIVCIFFLNERLGWALAWNVFPDSGSYLGTEYLSTTDGGESWNKILFQDTNRFLKSVYFLDSLNGYTGGSPGAIFKTTNGGARWAQTQIDTTAKIVLPVETIKFYNSNTGFASGGFRDLAGSMWKTTNGGILWKITVVGPEPLTDLYINNSSRLISVGGDFKYGASYVKSNNFGSTWIYDTLGVFGIPRAIDFRTPKEGWIAVGQLFSLSLDTGNTWSSFPVTDSVRLEDLCFTDSLNGWAVGFDGAILKYSNPKSSVNENSVSDLNGSFYLYQNFPNPFNPNTQIRYYLNKRTFVSLKIFDAIGKEIATLADEFQNKGNYSVNFSGNGLPSGVYYCRLSSGNISIVNKLMLLK